MNEKTKIELKVFSRFIKENNLFQDMKKADYLINYNSSTWLSRIAYNSNEINGKYWSDLHTKWLIYLFLYYNEFNKKSMPQDIKHDILSINSFLRDTSYEKYMYDDTYNLLLYIVKNKMN